MKLDRAGVLAVHRTYKQVCSPRYTGNRETVVTGIIPAPVKTEREFVRTSVNLKRAHRATLTFERAPRKPEFAFDLQRISRKQKQRVSILK